MIAKDLIAILEKLPQDLPIRLVNKDSDEENIWLCGADFNKTGDSGYEVSGDIRLLGSE